MAELKNEIGKVIIGQEYMVDGILIGLLTGGHILLEGVPGLAKSLTASTVAHAVGLSFKRIQFTPIYCRRTSSAPRSTTRRPASL